MESFFFNITDNRYKRTELFKKNTEHITRVDISNGIVFFDINLENNKEMTIPVKNLDRMIVLSADKNGEFEIIDNIKQKKYISKKGSINIFCSSRQDFSLTIKQSKKSEAFILFIADFFLKRYLSSNKNEPIDFLYNKIQKEISLEMINSQPIDALSLYIINKIINSKEYSNMNSIRYEHNIMEFIIHRFSLLHMYEDDIKEEELKIAKKAKENLLENYVNAPTISQLAHICATNESKLKTIFKKVYKMTIYNYIQKLRLEKANLLLKDKVLNIGEIAHDVGYKHQGHFSKLFFEKYGIYPKDLLKS